MHHGGSVPETRGNVPIRGLWKTQTEAIIDVRFGDADTETWEPYRMDKLLAGWEKTKKDKHGQACYDQQRHFSPFFLSVDGMMGKEALVILATLSRLMAAKLDEPILHVTGWVNNQIAITVARSYSRVLRGARAPSPLRTQEPQWVSGSGLGLAQ